jgi:hypothetical protein
MPVWVKSIRAGKGTNEASVRNLGIPQGGIFLLISLAPNRGLRQQRLDYWVRFGETKDSVGLLSDYEGSGACPGKENQRERKGDE